MNSSFVMTKIIVIRNVPAAIYRRLTARAAAEELSISDYVLREVGKTLERPTRREVFARIRARKGRALRRSAADVIRAEREAR